MSASSSTGGPVRTFAEASSIGIERTLVDFRSVSSAPRTSSARPGAMCSTTARSASSFSPGSVTSLAVPSTITER